MEDERNIAIFLRALLVVDQAISLNDWPQAGPHLVKTVAMAGPVARLATVVQSKSPWFFAKPVVNWHFACQKAI